MQHKNTQLEQVQVLIRGLRWSILMILYQRKGLWIPPKKGRKGHVSYMYVWGEIIVA